jgi:hypothetical protein
MPSFFRPAKNVANAMTGSGTVAQLPARVEPPPRVVSRRGEPITHITPIEAAPGTATRHLGPLPRGAQEDYLRSPAGRYRDGEDIYAQALGLRSRVLRGKGEYTNSQGVTEFNPTDVSRVWGEVPSMQAADLGDVQRHVNQLDQFLGAQEAVAPMTLGGRSQSDNLLSFNKGAEFGGREWEALKAANGGGFTVHQGPGRATAINPSAQQADAMRKVMGNPGVTQGGRADYIDATDAWTGDMSKFFGDMESQPLFRETLKRLDESPALREFALQKNKRDEAIARARGLPLRPEIMRARALVAEHGFSALVKAVKAGTLSVAAFQIFTGEMQEGLSNDGI